MSSQPQGPARLLVVSGDPVIRDSACAALQAVGRVDCCASGEDALAALRREPADLVIAQESLSGLSGVDLLEQVRRAHAGTEFVLLADADSAESVRALGMGAAHYLAPPVRGEELALVAVRILARRELVQESQRLRDTLEILEACTPLLRCLEASEVYAVALDVLLDALGRERGMAFFQRPEVPASDGVVFRGFNETEAERLRELLVDRKPVEPASLGQLETVSDSELHEVLRDVGIHCGRMLAIPLRGPEAEVGVLWVFEDARPFAPGEIERTLLISAQAEIALHNAERYGHAKERAFLDDVADVYNARYLLQATEREIQRAERYGKELCVLFLDLDRFKLVNDRYGHLVGSQTLRRLADVLKLCIRQVDTLARYGGDEFTILLLDTPIESGVEIAERIRRTVAETIFEGGRDAPIRLTISIGVAAYPQHGRDRDNLLDLSDKAMYRAKSLGRNCVCSASDLSG